MESLGRYYVARRLHRCPLCGSTDLMLDPARGELVCRSCGYVVEEVVFADTGPPAPAEEPRQRLPSTEARAVLALYQRRTAVTKLSAELGEYGGELATLPGEKPRELLALLRNHCIRPLAKRLPRKLLAALLDAVNTYEVEGHYPLFAELAQQYNLDDAEVRRLKRLLRRILRCRGAALPLSTLTA